MNFRIVFRGRAVDIAKRKLSKPILAYHGTSSSRLRSILKIGLSPDAKGRWAKDDSHGLQRSRVSYSGTYFTQNFMTAYSSASNLIIHEKNGANRLIIMANIQPMSTFLDEDNVSISLNNDDYSLIKAWILLRANKWDSRSSPETYRHVDRLLKYAYSLYIYDDEDAGDNRFIPNIGQLRDLAENVIKAEISRLASINWEYSRSLSYANRAIEVVVGENSSGNIPTRFIPPARQEAEASLRAALDAFIKKIKSHVPELRRGSKYTNFRITSPVKFAGANKIIAIAEIQKDKIITHYGVVPDDFKTQYASYIGKLPPIVKASDIAGVDTAIAHPDSYEYFKFSGARGVTLYRVERGKDSERILKTGDMFGVKPSSRKDLMAVIFPDAPGKAYYVPSAYAKRILKFSVKAKSGRPESDHAPSAPAHLIHTRNAWLHAEPKDKGSRATWIWFVMAKWMNIHRGVKVLPIDLYEECARLHNGIDHDKLDDKTVAKIYEKQLMRGRRAVMKIFGYRLRLSDVNNLASWIKDPRIKPKGAAALLMAEHDKRWKVANGKYIPIRFPAVKILRKV